MVLASQCKEYNRQISRGGGLGLGLEQCVQMHSQCVVLTRAYFVILT